MKLNVVSQISKEQKLKKKKKYGPNNRAWLFLWRIKISYFPAGQYYVYKKGQCPKGLKQGYVYWDDEDYRNANDKGGTLPDGEYDNDLYKKNTLIRFCCATGGDKHEPILLPSKSPFFLLAYASQKCQMVRWAVVSVEWIHYNTEYSQNHDEGVGAYPYNAGKKHPTIYYCYYRGEKTYSFASSYARMCRFC